MSSQMKYRSGVMETVQLPTAADGVATKSIEVGDLVVVVGGIAYPASYLSDVGDAAANRVAAAAAFAGVAVQKTGLQSGETSFKLTVDPGHVRVAVTGEFEFDCAATRFVNGDLVGVYNDATINSDQQVAKVTTYTEAIGVAKVPYNALGTSMTTVTVSLRSKLMHDAVGSGD